MANIQPLFDATSSSSLGELSSAFKIVERMADAYEHIKPELGQRRCKDIIQRAALIVRDAHINSRNDRGNIVTLERKLEEIQAILQKFANLSFFKALVHFESVNKDLDRANSYLSDCAQLLQTTNVSWHVQAQSRAAMSDREVLRALLKTLAGNYQEIRRRFGIHSDEQEDQAMVVMERELRGVHKHTSEGEAPVEVQILQRSLECIKATTRRHVPKQKSWLITEYDLEFCGTIGGGGFSTVSKARFRGTMVAVKTLRDVRNLKEALEREIEIWSILRHDHIVPFYGASTLTSPPFIVSRYMQNGNLVQYLVASPLANRTKLIFEVSLGMYYLHEEGIVHSDLKGVNILVDDAGKACITDFGLSKVCSSGTEKVRTYRVAGTLRFLAPEALRGDPLSFETDVYAFGMVIYEVFTEEVPFIREPDQMVLEGRVELRCPTSPKVYERGFNDMLWKLLLDCISSEPSERPRFKDIEERLRLTQKAEPTHPLHQEDQKLTDWGLQTIYPPSTPLCGMAALPSIGRSNMVGPESHNENLTDWGLDVPSPAVQPNLPSRPSGSGDLSVPRPILMELSTPSALGHPAILDTEDRDATDWGIDIKPTTHSLPALINNTAGYPGQGKAVMSEQMIISSVGSITRDIKTMSPMCILVTHRYFDVPFGIASREPGVYLERADAVQWQPVRAKKGTLLYDQGNRFLYRSGTGNGSNTWELDGSDVTHTTLLNKVVCHFGDAQTAQKWFRLQLNYARDGSMSDWGTAKGDLYFTERSWRRLLRDKVQQADLVEGAPNKVPPNRSWNDVNMPKRCVIDSVSGTDSYVDCITNPGKQPGRLTCKLDGRTIVSETYRWHSDKRPINVREETYPSGEYAGMTFHVLKMGLEKVAGKSR